MNGTDSEIVYYWIDHDGDEHHYGRVAPRSGVCQHTVEGHAWVVKDDDDENLLLFYAVLPRTLAFVSEAVHSTAQVGAER